MSDRRRSSFRSAIPRRKSRSLTKPNDVEEFRDEVKRIKSEQSGFIRKLEELNREHRKKIDELESRLQEETEAREEMEVRAQSAAIALPESVSEPEPVAEPEPKEVPPTAPVTATPPATTEEEPAPAQSPLPIRAFRAFCSMTPVTIAFVSTICSLVLGITVFGLARETQWRAAIDALRAEPGIEVLDVESMGFFRKRISGLRDPLAPSPWKILEPHQIGPGSVELFLTEYHSLNTPYAKAREEESRLENGKLHENLVKVVTEFSDTLREQSDKDFEKLSKLVLEARFPKELGSVDVRFQDGIWVLEGSLFEPVYSNFVSAVPDYLVRGDLRTADLVNRTETETKELQALIESLDLFETNQDNQLVHLPRLCRLLKDYDRVCEISQIPLPRIRIEIDGHRREELEQNLQLVLEELKTGAGVSSGRLLPVVEITAENGGSGTGGVRLVSLGSE